MAYCKEVDWLPEIPVGMLPTQEEIEALGSKWTPGQDIQYWSYPGTEDLIEFLSWYTDGSVGFQIMTGPLPPHVDNDTAGWKYVYNITTGGVTTRWYKHDEVVFSIEMEPLKWYAIKIDEMHDITAPTSPRIAIKVKDDTRNLSRL